MDILKIFKDNEEMLRNQFCCAFNKVSEIAAEATEVLKRLPDLPIIMDRANEVMTLIAEGKFNPNSLAYHNLREEELKLELMRNKILGGVLILVIIVLIVFK